MMKKWLNESWPLIAVLGALCAGHLAAIPSGNQKWTVGWEMFGAIGTIAAVAVALYVALGDTRRRRQSARARLAYLAIWIRAFLDEQLKLVEEALNDAKRLQGAIESGSGVAHEIRMPEQSVISENYFERVADFDPKSALMIVQAYESVRTARTLYSFDVVASMAGTLDQQAQLRTLGETVRYLASAQANLVAVLAATELPKILSED